MADQFYIEEGYVEANYFGYIAEAEISLSGAFSPSFTVDIADTTGYFIPDYIQTDYIAAGAIEAQATLSSAASITANGGKLQDADATKSAQFTVSVDVGVIKEGNASFTSAFTPTLTVSVTRTVDASLDASISILMTASPIRQGEVTLNNIVNLSLQGARTRDTSAAFSSAFSQLAVVGSLQDATATLSTQFTQTNNAGLLQDITETYSSAFTQSANAISYTPRTPIRPLSPTFDNLIYSSGVKKYGSYSAQTGTTNQYRLEYTTDAEIAFIDNSSQWFVEFWYNLPSGNRQDSFFVLDDSSSTDINDAVLNILSGNSNDLFIFADDSTGTNKLLVGGENNYVAADNTWHHLLVIWDPSSGMKVYRDGSQVGSLSSFTIKTITNPRISIGSWDPESPDTESFFIDELRIVKGSTVLSDYGYTFSNTSQTVPTTAFTDDTDTSLLLHFENNSDDDAQNYVNPPETFTGDASINSAFSLSADVGATVDATVLQVSAASLSVDVNYIADHSATLNSQASISTLPGFVKDFSADFNAFNTQVSVVNKIGNTLVSIDSAFTLTADVNEIVQLESNLSTAFTQSADINAIFVDSANFNSAFTIETTSSGLIGGEASFNSAFAQTATVERIQPGAASLSGAFSQSAVGFIIVDGSASLVSQFTKSTDAQRFRETDIEFDSIATTINVINKIGQGLIGLDVNFNLSTDPVLIAGGGVLLEGVATQTVDIGKIVDPGADLDAAFTQSANGRLSTDAASAMSSAFTFTIDADITTEIETQFDAVNSLVVTTVDVFRGFEADFDSAVSTIIDGIRVRTDSASINSAFAQTTNAGKQVDAIIDLGALFTPSIDYRVLHIDQYVYTVPRETRSYTIVRESRSYNIVSENRTYTIQGD